MAPWSHRAPRPSSPAAVPSLRHSSVLPAHATPKNITPSPGKSGPTSGANPPRARRSRSALSCRAAVAPPQRGIGAGRRRREEDAKSAKRIETARATTGARDVRGAVVRVDPAAARRFRVPDRRPRRTPPLVHEDRGWRRRASRPSVPLPPGVGRAKLAAAPCANRGCPTATASEPHGGLSIREVLDELRAGARSVAPPEPRWRRRRRADRPR